MSSRWNERWRFIEQTLWEISWVSQKQLVHVVAPFHLSFVVTAKFYLNENAHLTLLSLPQVVVVPDMKTMEFFK
jgi:hypothetical protein